MIPFFRTIDRKLCIIMDTEQAKMITALCHLEFENIDLINSLLCYGYIDTVAGITFEVLAATHFDDGDYTVLATFEKSSFKIRSESVSKDSVIPVESEALNTQFAKRIEMIELYYEDKDIINSRNVCDIDHLRNVDFPDDVIAYLLPNEDSDPESIWVRLNKYVGVHGNFEIFEGRLLNEPFKDCGFHCKENVRLFYCFNNDSYKFLFIDRPVK